MMWRIDSHIALVPMAPRKHSILLSKVSDAVYDSSWHSLAVEIRFNYSNRPWIFHRWKIKI